MADLIHADTKGNYARSSTISSLKRKPNSWDALPNWLLGSCTLQPAPGTLPGAPLFTNAGFVPAPAPGALPGAPLFTNAGFAPAPQSWLAALGGCSFSSGFRDVLEDMIVKAESKHAGRAPASQRLPAVTRGCPSAEFTDTTNAGHMPALQPLTAAACGRINAELSLAPASPCG